jgi:hypothetical protein
MAEPDELSAVELSAVELSAEELSAVELSAEELLAPLPSWQLFASVATQSELLDEVGQPVIPAAVESPGLGDVAAPPIAEVGQAADALLLVESASILLSEVPTATPAPPAAAAPPGFPTSPASPTSPGITLGAAPAFQPTTAPLVDLGRPVRRSVFLPPLLTLAPVSRTDTVSIAPVGGAYQPGSLSRVIYRTE